MLAWILQHGGWRREVLVVRAVSQPRWSGRAHCDADDHRARVGDVCVVHGFDGCRRLGAHDKHDPVSPELTTEDCLWHTPEGQSNPHRPQLA